MTGKKLLAILLLSVAAVVVQGECPDADKITPCFCQKDGGETVGTCSNIANGRDLKKFAQNSDGYTYKKVILRDSELDTIPTVFFEQVKTGVVELINVKVPQLVEDIPHWHEAVQEIRLENLQADDFSWKYFQYCRNLQILTVDHTRIPKITTDFNRYISHDVKKVTFTYTSTSTIERDATKDLRSLQSIAVINNDLTALHRGMLPNPTYSGTALYFQNNKLTEIKEDVLNNMPNLKTLYLSGNQIVYMEKPAEDGMMERLDEVDISQNPLNCDCHFKWISEATNKNLKGICVSPKRLRGKTLNSLTADDFDDC